MQRVHIRKGMAIFAFPMRQDDDKLGTAPRADVMVDLTGLHARMLPALQQAATDVLQASDFIRGTAVSDFERRLNEVMGLDAEVVGCANGTDALSMALMALEVGPGDEVIVPDFSFISTAETVALCGATPVFADVDPRTFQLDVESAKRAHSSKTKAVIPVHLFGQCVDMSSLMEWAQSRGLWVIEDNAQSLGSSCFMPEPRAAGAIGHLGTTSFFPSKNLGCMGDGGAVLVGSLGRQMDGDLANKVRCIANHGSTRKYHHTMVGINSRLDTLQAAFLNVKLNHWSDIVASRQEAATRYDALIDDMNSRGEAQVEPPLRSTFSDHLFHQYCVLLPHGVDRDQLQAQLKAVGVASMVYYPTPLSSQPAFAELGRTVEGGTPCAHDVARRILALPMHTELTSTTQTKAIAELFRLLPSTTTKSSGLDALEAADT